MKEAAEFEGYMDDASEEFKALEKKLNHDLDRDLDYFSSDIKKMIATEIIKRYYYQRGNIIQQLKDDDGLKEAMKILNDPVKYKEMLSAPAAKVINKYISNIDIWENAVLLPTSRVFCISIFNCKSPVRSCPDTDICVLNRSLLTNQRQG